MSYGINICFKNCEPNKVSETLIEFKELLQKNKYELIKENYFWFRQEELYAIMTDIQDKSLKNRICNKYMEDWIRNLFSFRFYYSKEIKSICFSISTEIKEIKDWFDGEVYFQNSCDQDYDYKEWEFNKTFRKYVTQFKNIKTPEELIEKYKNISCLNDYYDYNYIVEPDALEYDKKSALYEICYDKVASIWNKNVNMCFIENEFFDYNTTIFLKRCLIGLEDVEQKEYLSYDWAEIFQYKKKGEKER